MALISTYWGPVRPLRHHFIGPDRKRDRIKSVSTKSVDALALSIVGKDPRSIAPKVTLGDREERFTLECAGKVTLRILIHGNHWSPCTETGLTVCC